MQIHSVDHWHDLFRVDSVCPLDLAQDILATPWLDLKWQRQQGQENWLRRRVDTRELAWIHSWDQHMRAIWPAIESAVGVCLAPYDDTAWWLDEPGFVCEMHTDGEMPGAMHVYWSGATTNLGTTFYHYRNTNTTRVQFPMLANTGYIMINLAREQGYRHLQWHGMLQPVPDHTFRLTSYSWIIPQT